MGCDIHGWAEIKENDQWKLCDSVFTDWRGNPTSEFYDGRNYQLFSILANVRNSNKITPISLPKGMPYDYSAEYKKEIKDWGLDGHSHSYLTLKEIQEYPWDEDVTLTGCVSIEEYLLNKDIQKVGLVVCLADLWLK